MGNRHRKNDRYRVAARDRVVNQPLAIGRAAQAFIGFKRLNFGIIQIRTDGQRVLAFTHSGKQGLNEAYRFTVSPTGDTTFAAKVTKRSAPSA